MTRANGWKEEAAAVVGVLTLIALGALVFIMVMMPFVFPVVLAAAALAARRLTRTPRTAAA